MYFEITKEGSEPLGNAYLAFSDISYYIKEKIEKEDVIPWRMKINARVIDRNKVLSSGWRFRVLEHLRRSSFKVNDWKEFDGIKYRINYREPDEPIFLFEIPITNSKKYFTRKVKEEANQIPKDVKGVIAMELNSSLNIQRFSKYANEILTRDSQTNHISGLFQYS